MKERYEIHILIGPCTQEEAEDALEIALDAVEPLRLGAAGAMVGYEEPASAAKERPQPFGMPPKPCKQSWLSKLSRLGLEKKYEKTTA